MTAETHPLLPRVTLITGERDTGKTTLCLALHRHLTRRGVAVAGLITEQPEPHTLVSVELRNGQRHTLTHPFESDRGIAFTNFRLNLLALQRSAAALRRSFPTQLFILDELGPLELLHGEGWVEALTLLGGDDYEAALIVVRPALLAEAVRQLPPDWLTLIRLTEKNRDEVQKRLAQDILSAVDVTTRR